MQLVPPLSTLGAVLALSAFAGAQSINADIGMGLAPSAAYGGAAGQPGLWNAVNPLSGLNSLADINGNPTGFAFHFGGAEGYGGFDAPATSGEEEVLMDDHLDVGATPWQTFVYCLGLEPAVYDIYVYAWNPEDPQSVIEVDIAAADFGGP